VNNNERVLVAFWMIEVILVLCTFAQFLSFPHVFFFVSQNPMIVKAFYANIRFVFFSRARCVIIVESIKELAFILVSAVQNYNYFRLILLFSFASNLFFITLFYNLTHSLCEKNTSDETYLFVTLHSGENMT